MSRLVTRKRRGKLQEKDFHEVLRGALVPVVETVTVKTKTGSEGRMMLTFDGGHGTADGKRFEFSACVTGSVLKVDFPDEGPDGRTFTVDVRDVVKAVVPRLNRRTSK